MLIDQLDAFLRRHKPSSADQPFLAVFDCDDTLIRGDIGESMFYYQLEHFLLRVSPANLWPDYPKREELSNLYESLSTLVPAKAIQDRRFISFADMILDWYFNQLAEGKTAKACSDIVRLFAGFTRNEVWEIAEATAKKELASPLSPWRLGTHTLPRGVRYIKEAVELLKHLQEAAFDIWVVSGSNRWSVEAVCEPLVIHPDRVIGIDLEETGGMLTERVKKPVPVLEGKVEALKENTSTKPIIVVSDSTYDIPLFNYSAGLKILVRSSNGQDFFKIGQIRKDESWVVISSPSLIDQNAWQTRQ